MTTDIFDARSVANEVIQLADKDGRSITNLGVLKLVYFSHGFMLGRHHKQLFWQEVIAWPYGPIVIDVYEPLKIYGRERITQKILMPGLVRVNGKPLEVIEEVYSTMGGFSPSKLVSYSHAPDGPWAKIWNDGFGLNQVIPRSEIEPYFGNLFSK